MVVQQLLTAGQLFQVVIAVMTVVQETVVIILKMPTQILLAITQQPVGETMTIMPPLTVEQMIM